jgi:hypothetical protein
LREFELQTHLQQLRSLDLVHLDLHDYEELALASLDDRELSQR